MSENETTLLPQHALLVAWGEYAQSLGLVKKIAGVLLDQKEVEQRPQRKVLEFFVAILGGLPYLKDISRSAHPLPPIGIHISIDKLIIDNILIVEVHSARSWTTTPAM